MKYTAEVVMASTNPSDLWAALQIVSKEILKNARKKELGEGEALKIECLIESIWK